jgi:hypothetical protein
MDLIVVLLLVMTLDNVLVQNPSDGQIDIDG